jgi:uncharacterized protein YodC (DUF2158 family)
MSRSRKFTPGELVRPKQGGPAMRVDRYGDFDLVHCIWLDEKHGQQSKPFLENMLDRISFSSNQNSSDAWSNPDKSSS